MFDQYTIDTVKSMSVKSKVHPYNWCFAQESLAISNETQCSFRKQ